jgi:SAM-dependent MidA family methyltransferase
MRKIQCKNLCNLESEPQLYKSYRSIFSNSIEIKWVQDLNEIPKVEAVHFYLANEFFDALPIHKLQVGFFFLLNSFF